MATNFKSKDPQQTCENAENSKHPNLERQEDELELLSRNVYRRMMTYRQNIPKGTGLSVYKPRATDVVITTFPKAGTTLLQQMAYQIAVVSGGAGPHDRTGEHFTDISEVAPWLDYSPQFNCYSYETFPRIFKSHSKAEKFTNEQHHLQKHVVVIRNPDDFPASWLNFLYDVITTPLFSREFSQVHHSCDNDDFRERVFHHFVTTELLFQKLPDEHEESALVRQTNPCLRMFDWFSFTKQWLQMFHESRNNNEQRILILFYEDVVENLTETVCKLANFMNVRISDDRALVEKVVSRCRREYMAGNKKFTCQIEARYFLLDGHPSKANHISSGSFQGFSLSPQERHILRQRFRDNFGVDSYGALRQMYKGLLSSPTATK